MDRWTLEQPEVLLHQVADAIKTVGELVQESVVPLLEDLLRQVDVLQKQVDALGQKHEKQKRVQRIPVKEFHKPKCQDSPGEPVLGKEDRSSGNGGESTPPRE